MKTVTISEQKLQKVLSDVETLIEDVTALLDQDEVAMKRLSEIRATPSIGKSEQELDRYR